MSSLGKIKKSVQKLILQQGDYLLKESRSKISVRTKSSNSDLVTNIDWKVENDLKTAFSKILPASEFLAEETDDKPKKADQLWIIDPIDGTTNYVHNFPFYCISVALQLEGEIKLGFVYNPAMKEFFVAEKDNGSTLNDKTICTSPTQNLSRSLLATGFAYNYNNAEENNIKFFAHFHKLCHGIRRPGSAALDLCYVAKGVFEGFWEWYLNPWDVAAGILIVEEAGGKVSNFEGEPFSFNDNNILATNTSIHSEMLNELKTVLNSENTL